MGKNFSKKEAFKFGWETFKQNKWFFIRILAVVAIINFVPAYFVEATKKDAPVLSLIINLIGGFFALFIQMGLIKIALKLCDLEKPYFRDLFSCLHLFFKYASAAILCGLITFSGLILLIIPGIIWGIQFGFSEYLVVDKAFGPIAALKRSSAITKGVKWDLFIFGILFCALNILGALCLLIGLFISVPVSMVAVAFVYRKLLSQS